MIHNAKADSRTIVFGVTSSQSLKLLGNIPSKMEELGFKVHLVAGDSSWEIPKNLSGIPLHKIPMRRNPSLIEDSISLMQWVLLLARLKPEIVVVGTPKAGLLGILAARLCRVRFRIYHLRGLRLQTVAGPARNLLLLAEWATAKFSTSILAVSASLMQEYAALGICPPDKLVVLGLGSSHGVDFHHFNSHRWMRFQFTNPLLRQSVTAGTPVLGFVGRFSNDKGAEELLRCAEILLQTKTIFTLLVIGPIEGNKEFLKILRGFNNVVITGPVTDVAPYYSPMDLLILPTHREGFPNAVLEAAASGVPSITTDATGAIDSVIHGKTGMIVPRRDGVALADAVKCLLAEPHRLKEMGRNARTWARSNFEASRVTLNHTDYLTQILGHNEKEVSSR